MAISMDQRVKRKKKLAARLGARTLGAWLPKVFLLAPITIGLIGFSQTTGGFCDESGVFSWQVFWDAAFDCLTMYGLNFGRDMEKPWNNWLEWSRWLAPIATASGLVMAFDKLQVWLRRLLARLSFSSVAVYGDSVDKEILLMELGWRGIDLGEKFVRARRYVLVGSEEENLEFYERHYDRLKNRQVYLKSQSLPAQLDNDPKLHLFCPEELAARMFWKEYCPYQLSKQADHKMKIVMLGFGKLGRELLEAGLQYNIFHPDQRIEYHIFGDEEDFLEVHWQLQQIADPVEFHDEPWRASLDMLKEAQMLIVVEQEQQLDLLGKLSLALPNKQIHVLAAAMNGAEMLGKGKNFVCFDWKEETLTMDCIANDRLYHLAMRINLQYNINGKIDGQIKKVEQMKQELASVSTAAAPEKKTKKQRRALQAAERELWYLQNRAMAEEAGLLEAWNDPGMTDFARYSSISAAEFYDVCVEVLEGKPVEEKLEFLAELEHIRWCRYHYLHNWVWGPKRDKPRRIHHCLKPYEELPEEEKQKDRDNILMTFGLVK